MKTRKHWSDSALFIKVPTPKELPAAVKVALEAGAQVVHMGHERCGFCGAELDPEIKEMSGTPSQTGSTIVVHLCHDCWKAGYWKQLQGVSDV